MSQARNIWLTIKKFNTRTSMVVVFLLLSLLVISNYANSQNLVRSELTDKIRTTEDSLRLLNISVSELQNTKRIESESQRLDLVKMQTTNIYYLKTSEEKVALK